MLRSICAVVISVIAWFLVATVGNLLIRRSIAGLCSGRSVYEFHLAGWRSRALFWD